MALLRLAVSSIDMTTAWSASLDDGRPNSRNTLRLTVCPEAGDYLQLKTGEIFGHPAHPGPTSADRGRIAGTLVVEQVDPGHDCADNKLRYLAGAANDRASDQAAIEFYWGLPREEYCELLCNLRSGLIPTKARITLQHEIVEGGASLRFNLEADGNGIRWDNDNAAARKLGIKIERVSLQFGLHDGPGDKDAKAMAAAKEARDHLTRIGGELRRIGVILIGGIAALVIASLIRH